MPAIDQKPSPPIFYCQAFHSHTARKQVILINSGRFTTQNFYSFLNQWCLDFNTIRGLTDLSNSSNAECRSYYSHIHTTSTHPFSMRNVVFKMFFWIYIQTLEKIMALANYIKSNRVPFIPEFQYCEGWMKKKSWLVSNVGPWKKCEGGNNPLKINEQQQRNRRSLCQPIPAGLGEQHLTQTRKPPDVRGVR